MIFNIEAKVVDKYNINDNIYILNFELISPSTLNFTDGQYISVEVSNNQRRSYSIFSSSSESTSMFKVLVTTSPGGIGSRYFEKLEISDVIVAKGPLGFFTKPSHIEKNLVFICTGTGFGPINSIIKGLINTKKYKEHNIHLFYGERNLNNIVYSTEYSILFRSRIITTYLKCISQSIACTLQATDKNLFKGRVTKPVVDFINKNGIHNTDYFLCGSGEMIKELANELSLRGTDQANIHFEKFY